MDEWIIWPQNFCIIDEGFVGTSSTLPVCDWLQLMTMSFMYLGLLMTFCEMQHMKGYKDHQQDSWVQAQKSFKVDY